jgi:hypothetical protein
MLNCIFSLREEVQDFRESKEKSVHEFQDPQWMCDFGFLVDVTGHLNQLSCRVQGKDQLIHTAYDTVKYFRRNWLMETPIESE